MQGNEPMISNQEVTHLVHGGFDVLDELGDVFSDFDLLLLIFSLIFLLLFQGLIVAAYTFQVFRPNLKPAI